MMKLVESAKSGFLAAFDIRANIAWIFYMIGDLVSKILELIDKEWWCNFWHPVYTYFMSMSDKIQGDGNGPWKNCECCKNHES